jgi:hypothetical protein
MALKTEVINRRDEIKIDSYPMSIGEIISIYRDNELEIHPEFQRFYRWDNEQKSRLIESILLGIPIPPIYVAQKQSGHWDVIDGQQRLSTILEFSHNLKGSNGDILPALILQGTKLLPSLDGVSWDNNELFTEDLKLGFKREKLTFTIIKEKHDSENTKYELFQRINTGGTHLAPQELRNCLLIMINRDFFLMLEALGDSENFRKCYPMTETQSVERQDLEMVLRTAIFIYLNDDAISQIDKSRNIDNFTTDTMERIAIDTTFNMEAFISTFNGVFDLLQQVLADDSFRKYRNGKFTGAVLMASFEAIVPGLCVHYKVWSGHMSSLKDKIISIYDQDEFISATRRGVRPLDRFSQLILFSRRWFQNED